MGCTITVVKPEHRILDHCLEIGKLISEPNAENLDKRVQDSLNGIILITETCEILPCYCLRELRHCVESLHHKQYEIGQKLDDLAEKALNSVRGKTLSASGSYKCAASPNYGTVDFYFPKTSTPRFVDTTLEPKTAPTTPSTAVNKSPRSLAIRRESKNPNEFNFVFLESLTLENPIDLESKSQSPGTQHHDYGFFDEERHRTLCIIY